jgi:hypothetical protein
MDECRKWKVRKKVGYAAQQRFWIIKGWKYKHMNLLIRANRWCKLIGDKKIWAFEHEVCERYIVYRFVVGTGPCANLAYRLPKDDANHSSSVAKLNSTSPRA